MKKYYKKDEVLSLIGNRVKVKIDRRKGSTHPNYPDLVYEVNYGYIPDTLTDDGEELDAYVLDDDVTGDYYEGVVIGVAVRKDDNENKLVVAKEKGKYQANKIKSMINFQEKYFDSEIFI